MTEQSIPDDFAIGRLVGQEVIQVCIGRHHVRINLSMPQVVVADMQKWGAGAAIDIEAGFVFRDESSSTIFATNGDLGSKAGSLTALLGQTISSAGTLEHNELIIRFTNKTELQLVTAPDGFESYHLHIEGESYDVTKPRQDD